MARQKIVMPQMGESITTGTITTWHKQVGDKIELDEILLDISTDKVESEIPSPFEGRIASLCFPEGETVEVGVLIAEVEDDDSVALDGGAAASPSAPSAPKEEVAQPAAVSSVSAPQPSRSNETTSTSRFYTPLVRVMAQEHGVALSELEHLQGSGAGGRVNRSDFENYLKNRSQSGASASSAPAKVDAFSQKLPPGSYDPSRVEVIPMDNMRKAIAKNMVLSKQVSPHVNSVSEIDMTHLVKFRESFKNEFLKQEGIKLTYTPFILWAIIQALKEYPLVNSSVDGDKIVIKKDINLGCAVAVPGNGLTVPVIKNADTMNLRGLCRSLNTLAQKARDKKLSMDDLSGGTFTFSNVGSFGTLLATPVILQPQVGIYAAGVIQKRPVVIDDAIGIRSMMYGTHSYDHRLVDGELGGKFLESIHKNLKEMRPKDLF
jgi:pyruvate dehydrogenase E2 component (dihydrolipoamide acetyltransferase)